MKQLYTFIIILATAFYSKAVPPAIDNHIKVDQFGYLCDRQKIAIVSNPQVGFNASQPFAPGTGTDQYQVRRWSDDMVVFAGTLQAWNGGTTHAQSGDKVWWFDFSSVSEQGSYYVYDTERKVGSYKFEIGTNVYKDVMKHAMRSFYYQRSGFAKVAPYADAGWVDGASHLGALQDKDCRLYGDNSPATSKDLSGGWFDAGDYNKYVNFAWTDLTDLLLAYDENPDVFTDDYNIPESGNGVPDLLDEVKWEMDWLLKMQQSNGSVLCIVGGGGASPPSADKAQRFYGPATTSATLSASSIFALGAIQYGKIPAMATYAATLKTAAINAWNWASANPNVKFTNSGKLAAGEQEFSTDSYDYSCMMRKLGAACFLYSITQDAAYKTYFDANWSNSHLAQWYFAYPFESTEQDVLLYYAKVKNATTSVASSIKSRFSGSTKDFEGNFKAYTSKTDAYRAYLADNNYTWGSNKIKCVQAQMFLNMNVYNLDAANSANYINAASGFLHYMHGTNPLALVYLSNMGNYGAENSVREFYHSWFTDGSAKWDRVGSSTYGPAPGFVPGGPNPGYSLDGCCATNSCGSSQNNALCVVPPQMINAPVQKSFFEWNTNWPQNSWAVTENSCGYQTAYVRLLSNFMKGAGCVVTSLNNAADVKLANVFPNPSGGDFELKVSDQVKESLEVIIFNNQGEEVVKSQKYQAGDRIVFGENLKSGIYMVTVKSNGIKQTLKVVKTE